MNRNGTQPLLELKPMVVIFMMPLKNHFGLQPVIELRINGFNLNVLDIGTDIIHNKTSVFKMYNILTEATNFF